MEAFKVTQNDDVKSQWAFMWYPRRINVVFSQDEDFKS